MARRPTPRPTYPLPTVIRPDEVTRHLWGDETSGFVGDEVLVSSSRLHALIFTLPPGARFRHSDQNRTIFACDEVYLVLEGTLVLIEPESGQVVRAEAGEAVVFGRDTWHHGYNPGTAPVRVLEYLAPPPAAGATSAYAAGKPLLARILEADDSLLGAWPAHRADAVARDRFGLVRPADQRLRLDGELLTGLILSTPELTVGAAELRPAGSSSLLRHDGDALLHVRWGELHAHVPEGDGPSWHRVVAGESFFVPAGTAYRLVNQSAASVGLTLGVAPRFLPEG